LDNAAFLNLVQHHGYPTPLLDWTISPFIGAYFAFRNLRRGRFAPDQKVRIFILDGRQWVNDWEASVVMAPAFRHLTLLEPLAINNPRATPQQSVSSVTNVDDIETYIRNGETIRGTNYLRAIDLAVDDRRIVMQELALMGVNAGSLLPGLDGACEQLRERFFDL
jgi:FRG domain